MDDSLHSSDLLIRYLDNDLPVAEKNELERRLQTDIALQEELQRLRIAVQAIRQLGTVQSVNAVHNDMMSELRHKKSPVVPLGRGIKYTLAVAAMILFIVIGAQTFFNTTASTESIYKNAFVDFDVSVNRGDNVLQSQIEKRYQEKNYPAVTTLSRSRTLSAKDSLLIGLSYLHQEKVDQAIGFFQPLTTTVNNFQPDAEFYLSLSYLKKKNYNKAAALMKRIAANPAHLYHQQITSEMLGDIEKLVEN